jgi:two-component sensor histidine kinase
LVLNSLKHAFPKNAFLDNQDKLCYPGNRSKEAEIRIEFTKDNSDFILIVSDNGVGFPRDLDFRKTDSLGLQLVTNLTKQIQGTIELERSGGTAFKITFRT